MKTLERLCDRYIRDVILRVKPLSKYQHAYLSGCSQAIGYADDIAILVTGAFEEVLGQLIQRAFRLVEL